MSHWFKRILYSIILLIILVTYFITIIITSMITSPDTCLKNTVWNALGRIVGKNSVTDVVHNIGPRARETLQNYYVRAGIDYPGDKVACLIFDEEASMEIWAKNKDRWKLIHTHSTKTSSTGIGEGTYEIIGLNSNLWYPLSMRFQSENSSDDRFDVFLDRASFPRDVRVGHDELSAGYFLSDHQFEELFILAHDVDISNIEIIMSPLDLRKKDPKLDTAWYRYIKDSLQRFK